MTRLKKRILKAGLIEYKCSCCGITEWNGKPIVLQLHHINGDNRDNRKENLTFLCPNCHSQTDSFCGKNKEEE
jgi:Zn finger protein HypA/HybF involved in hydrogenase expression